MTDPTEDPDAAEVLACVDKMHCGCGGLGVVADAAPVGGALWLVTWSTEHAASCPGRRRSEITYAVDIDRLARGDFDLPAAPGDRP